MILKIKYLFANVILGIMGWRVEYRCKKENIGVCRRQKKYITFGEPHTHILDFFYMILFIWYYRIENYNFLVNSKYFYPIIGRILTYMGAIGVDKKKSGDNLVKKIVKKFQTNESFILLISPSGKRKWGDKWYSGFYYISLEANVPLIPSYIDYERKRFGYFDPIIMQGEPSEDMKKLRDLYKDIHGIVRKNESVIRIKEEDI